ncbi:MAG: HAMP domain-containing protein, partial [Deltaproteobacteria bacterium]|nr:HAMP domain-containing protein [Deltaproteobacteria bacterium]
MKPKLWHKIFLYSFLTIIITQVFTLGFYLFTYDQDLRVKTTVDYLAAISKNLEGLSDEEFKSFVEVYRVGHRRVWLEDRAGGILIGEPWPGMTAGVRDQVTSKRYDYDHGMTALVLRTAEPAIVVEIETTRAGVPALICFNWQRASLVQYWGVFVQGVLGLIGLSLVLSLWTSKRISKPLWDLRNSLMKISAGDLALRLSQEGEDEIADVSAAVNQLTDNLSKHMTGMKQLMANMSHELRSSVTNLSMSLEILEAALNAPTAKPTLNGASPAVDSEPGSVAKEANLISENLNQARLEVNLLENMVASGLLGGKLDLKHEELESAPLDFSSLCRQTVSRFTHLAA